MALKLVRSMPGGCGNGGWFGELVHGALVVWGGGSPALKGCFDLF